VIVLAALAGVFALGAAPGCPGALAAAAATADADLARAAEPLLARLEAEGAGGPTGALAEEAEVLRRGGGPAPDAAQRFRAALAAHCTLAARPPLAAATAVERARLAGILGEPVYRRARLDPGALRRWVLGLWGRLVEALGTSEAERYAELGRTLFLAAAAGAAVALGWAARRRRARDGAAPRGADLAPALPRGPAQTELGPAEAAAARGDGPEAVRLALRAALCALHRDGAAPPADTLTNAELVGQARLAGSPRGAAGDLRALVAAFDRAVYGRRPVTATEARTALEAARRLGAGAPSRAPGAS